MTKVAVRPARQRDNSLAGGDYEEISLQRRLKWFLLCRLGVAILGIGAILIWQSRYFASGQHFPPRIIIAYILLIGACFINILYLLALKWPFLEYKKQALIQISLDIFLITVLAYCTGGIGTSLFVYLYFASIVADALLVSARSSFFFASLATLLLSSVTITHFLGAHWESSLPLLSVEYLQNIARELRFTLPYLFFFALVLHLVAVLAGFLARELNRERVFKEEILANIVNGLIVADHQGKIVFYNSRAVEMLGLPQDKNLSGLRIEDAFSNREYHIIKEALTNKNNLTYEFTLAGQAEPIHIEITTSSIWGPKREIRGVMAILNDISLKRKIDEITKRADTLRMLSEMSVSIAHEIRNPLAAVNSAIQEIHASNKFTPAEKKLMDIIIKESDRLNQIITEFLDFARERPMVPQHCNLTGLLEEVITLLKTKGLAKDLPDGQTGIRIKTEWPVLRSPPATSEGEVGDDSLICEADPEQLKQVFFNLGLNAIESTKTDGPEPRKIPEIIFRAYQSSASPLMNQGVVVEVIDFGVGIEPNLLSRIYDPFFTTKPKGIGLGLAVASRIIQAHKGKIWVESQPNRGTKLSVWLPQSQIKM